MSDVSENALPAAHEEIDVVAPLAQRVREVPRLHYLHSYAFIFESPVWFTNVLLTTCCMFVPVVGAIVMAGYQYEIVAALHRHPKQTYPDFDFNRLTDYLSRGVWSFLVGLLTQMIVVPVNFVVFYGAMMIIAIVGAASGQANSAQAVTIAAMILVPLALLVAFGVPLMIRFFTMPLVLRASLSQEGGELFNIPFLLDFIRRTWKEMLLEETWIVVTTPVVTVIGLILCFVGIYPAFALTRLADAQTNWQLYEIYLARGGEEIGGKSAKPGKVVPWPADAGPA